MTTTILSSLAIRIAATPPPLTQQDQIRINFQALLISVSVVALIVAAVFLISRQAGRRRYAAHQARLAAEGRADRSGALAELASGPATKWGSADEAAAFEQAPGKASVFGENYRPVDTN